MCFVYSNVIDILNLKCLACFLLDDIRILNTTTDSLRVFVFEALILYKFLVASELSNVVVLRGPGTVI